MTIVTYCVGSWGAIVVEIIPTCNKMETVGDAYSHVYSRDSVHVKAPMQVHSWCFAFHIRINPFIAYMPTLYKSIYSLTLNK